MARINNLVIIGAGGHGKVVADAAECMGKWSEISFVDKMGVNKSYSKRWRVDGSYKNMSELRKRFTYAAIAIGDAEKRLELLEQFDQFGFELPVIRHPSSIIAKDVELGAGSVVTAGAIVNSDVVIGRGCIVNTGASIDHDCKLGDGVHICPGARIAGGVIIGSKSWIGLGAVIIQQLKIGMNVTVGAGAVVIADIGDNVTVIGNPAKELVKRFS